MQNAKATSARRTGRTKVDLLIDNCGQVVTLAGDAGPRRGAAMRELGSIENGAVAVAGGRVVETGPARDLRARYQARTRLDAGGRAVVPGFVDPHTHLPWAGDRAAEFEMRIRGATYMQIMAAGGGILRTVADTRAATLGQLTSEMRPRLARMLAHGTTTAEAKTGYGLNLADELKQLEAIAALQTAGLQTAGLQTAGLQTAREEERADAVAGMKQPIDLVPTFLGAHAVPPEYTARPDEYVDLIVEAMLPAVQGRWQEMRSGFPSGWPLFCDVFCEAGAFDVQQSRRILSAAQALGLGLKLHVDEFAPLGGTPLAVEMGAVSADHLVTTPADHLAMLAASTTIAVALPGTPFGLAQRDYPAGRALIDQGGALALATDMNPGTCWCESLQFVIALACRYMRLLPSEALVAATLNAAYAIGLGAQVGSLEPGKLADLVILDATDYRMLGYRFGTNLARAVIKRGQLVAGPNVRKTEW